MMDAESDRFDGWSRVGPGYFVELEIKALKKVILALKASVAKLQGEIRTLKAEAAKIKAERNVRAAKKSSATRRRAKA